MTSAKQDRKIEAPILESPVHHLQTRFFIICLATASLLLATVLYPLWSTIFWAIVIAITFYPLYKYVLSLTANHSTWAALISTFLTVLCVIIPIIITLGIAANELIQFVENFLQSKDKNDPDVLNTIFNNIPFIDLLIDNLGIQKETVISHIKTSVETIGRKAAAMTVPLGKGAIVFFFHFALMCYLLFFLFKDGHRILDKLIHTTPLNRDIASTIAIKFNSVVQATMRGNFTVAALQGAVGGVLFATLGIPSAFLFGVLMTLAALVPMTGCALIWFPVAIYKIYSGDLTTGIVILIFGALVISLIDNLLRPILVGKDTKLPDYVVLFTTFGGLTFYGAEGFVLGPLFAGLFIVLWDILSESMTNGSPRTRTPDSSHTNNENH